MKEPLFSVIIPTYNRSRFLQQAVGSVVAQTVDDFEILVINDGGSEPEGLPADSRLRVITRPVNGGLAAARNTGLEAASGRYVTFLDDDDLYLPNRLEVGLAGLARAPVALCMMRSFRGDVTNLSPKKGRVLVGDVHDTILDGPTPQAGRVSLERDLAPRFDESYLACEDIEWWLRLSALAPVASVDEIALLQRGHDGPRNLNTAEARLAYHRKLLSDYEQYFASHRRARGYRYLRIGIRELALDERTSARTSLLKSFLDRPSLRAAYHLMRTLKPLPN